MVMRHASSRSVVDHRSVILMHTVVIIDMIIVKPNGSMPDDFAMTINRRLGFHRIPTLHLFLRQIIHVDGIRLAIRTFIIGTGHHKVKLPSFCTWHIDHHLFGSNAQSFAMMNIEDHVRRKGVGNLDQIGHDHVDGFGIGRVSIGIQ